MLKSALKWIGRPLWSRMKARIDDDVDLRIDATARMLRSELTPPPPPPPPPIPMRALWVPPCPPVFESPIPFMSYSTCSAADFMHARYGQICANLKHAALYHRKVWEWAYVVHQLGNAGVLKEGSRGLGFGVGVERLPSYFAQMGAEIVATDAPPAIGEAYGWRETGQYSSALDQLRYLDLVDAETFARNVTHRECDMNHIPHDLCDFDFTWSCCSFEHLGTLEAGMQFVINSVEKTLKVGGIACHTTEFNLSSNDETVREGETVVYRRRDIEELVARLEQRGHHVKPFLVAPDSHYMDGFVDVPPYTHNPHIKLLLEGYVVTSVGIVVTRGK